MELNVDIINLRILTRNCKQNMLNRSECGGPFSIEGYQDKHQSLSMEWCPAEEEGKHDNN